MNNIKHAIIITAGLGSRLGFNIPKSLVKVGNKKIIDYHLELLKDVPDVRIVVGYKEEKVKKHVKKIRENVTFITNQDYANTSNAYSVSLAAENIKEPYLLVIGDIIFNKNDFKKFVDNCDSESIVGLTISKSEDAVFTDVDEDSMTIKKFQRNSKLDYETAGIFYFNGIPITKEDGYVFEALKKYLPIKYMVVRSYEVDTPVDLELVINNLHELELEDY